MSVIHYEITWVRWYNARVIRNWTIESLSLQHVAKPPGCQSPSVHCPPKWFVLLLPACDAPLYTVPIILMPHWLFRPNFYYIHFSSSIHSPAPKLFPANHRISTSIMSYRPNYQGGGRRGGASSSGRGGGRRGGGGRGEQRWWDPVWRAERLRQQQAEVKKFNLS